MKLWEAFCWVASALLVVFACSTVTSFAQADQESPMERIEERKAKALERQAVALERQTVVLERQSVTLDRVLRAIESGNKCP